MGFAADCLPLTNRADRLFDKLDFRKTPIANVFSDSAAGNTAFGKKKI